MYLLWPPVLKHAIFYFLCLVSCNGSPSYYITTPANTIYGANISMAVHWFGDMFSEINVTAEIIENGNSIASARKVFQNDSIGIMTLPAVRPQNFSTKSYMLVVNGSVQNIQIFNEITQISVEMKNISMLIQTDKPLYKAEENVKIRIICVTNSKPYNGDVDLEIRDPGYNIVQQQLGMKSHLGVVSTEFSLSNNPMLGAWNIQATCNGFVKTVTFSVAVYVEPKFKVMLECPPFYMSQKQLNLTCTVTAKYLFGIPLKGSVTVWVKPQYGFDGPNGISKTYQISGSINFSFTHAEIQSILYWESLNITASVTEEFTDIVVIESSIVARVDSEYSIKRVDDGNPQAFMPGEKFIFKVQIQRIDKNSLTTEERKEMVSATITQFADENWLTSSSPLADNITLQNYTIPDSAIIDMEFPVLQSTNSAQVQVIYQNTIEFFYFDKQYGTNPTIQVEILETFLKVGTPFSCKVKTFPPEQDIYYVVIANGTIVSAGKSKTTFSLTPDYTWTPTAQLLVYYLNMNGSFGDIVQNKSRVFFVKTTFENKVTLSWSKNRAEPSEMVSLSISVKESRSLVCLQVVEKTSMLLQNRNDITASTIDELYTNYQSSLTSLTDAVVYSLYGYNPTVATQVAAPQQYIFPETWIWLDTNMSSLTTPLQVTVPNKNTTWVATAFVTSERLGLGVTDTPVEISVFKPLMTILHLPFSLTRGEQCILEVFLYNSLKENLEVLVAVESSNSFDIIVPDNNTNTVPGQYKVTVQSEGEMIVQFPINPKKLGNATVKVTVTSKAASEVLTKTMMVKAEGVKSFYSQSALFDLTGNTNQIVSKNFSFTFPSDVIQDTVECSVTAVGDLVVQSVKGLESLIMMPYGCGEQNMINFAPIIYVLQYFIATKQDKADVTKTAIYYMEQGYQTELNYKRNDGSFSAFGDYDSSGSTWLTAFVCRCFLQARIFIFISPDVLDKAVAWMVNYQDTTTGMFSEPGRVIHTELQGGLDGPTTLTAYIVTCMLEDEVYSQRYELTVQRSVKYLESKYDEGIASNHTLSVVVYALSLAKSSKAGAALDQLNSRATITGSAKYWSGPSVQSNYYWQPRTTDIETAAYALLSCYQQKKIADGILVMKWLSEQRNQRGGYVSTQDTVMALQALSQFVSVANFSGGATSLTLTMTGSGSFVPKTFQINSNNSLVLQRQQIEVTQPLFINASAEGTGLAISQLNVAYNQKTSTRVRRDSPLPEAFTLELTVKDDPSNIYKLSVDICTSYLGSDISGMVLLSVGLLSGFELSPIGIPTTDIIKLVEPTSDTVYLYLYSISTVKICVFVPLVRVANVANSQDAVVTIEEYYDPRNRATTTYNSETMKKISFCDFCGINCTQCRSNVVAVLVPETTQSNVIPPQSDSSAKPMFRLMCLCIILISYLL